MKSKKLLIVIFLYSVVELLPRATQKVKIMNLSGSRFCSFFSRGSSVPAEPCCLAFHPYHFAVFRRSLANNPDTSCSQGELNEVSLLPD